MYPSSCEDCGTKNIPEGFWVYDTWVYHPEQNRKFLSDMLVCESCFRDRSRIKNAFPVQCEFCKEEMESGGQFVLPERDADSISWAIDTPTKAVCEECFYKNRNL